MSLMAMALTAGQGTRLRPITETIAKPAIPFLGRPLLCHATRHLEALKVDKLVMNLHWCPDTIENVGQFLPPDLKVDYSDETEKLLGSGGGVKHAQALLQGADTILIFNGDEVFLPESASVLEELRQEHQSSGNLATLLVMEHPGVGTEFGGAWVDSQNNIQQFSKKPIAGLKGYHYVGYMMMDAKAWRYFSDPAQDENLLYDCVTRAIKAGEKVKVFPCQAQWFETGNVASFLKATKEISHQLRSPEPSPEIQELSEFLESTVHLGSSIFLDAKLVPFTKPGRADINVRIIIDEFIAGEYSLVTRDPYQLSDLVWFRKDNDMPGRKDELWKSTCAEMFIAEKDKEGYTEFNFASTLDWNAYSFTGERTGMKPAPLQCRVQQTFNNVRDNGVAIIQFQCALDLIPYQVGITAVVEWKDGTIEYYSLQHSKDKPDFHNRADWTWRLG